jgi:hypothetical protein
VAAGDGSLVVAQGRSGASHGGRRPQPLGEAWRASAALDPVGRRRPPPRGSPRCGDRSVVRIDGDALLGRRLVRRVWRAAHVFTDSSRGGGMAASSKLGWSWTTLVAGC